MTESTSNLISRAAAIASRWHDGQYRKYPDLIRFDSNGYPLTDPPEPIPYFDHCRAVAERLARIPGVTESEIAAAYLHDVIEDTACPEDEIERECGADVLKIVMDLTNRSKLYIALGGRPRDERKAADRGHLQACDARVKRIKLIDRTQNLRSMFMAPEKFRRKYIRESKELLRVIRDADADGVAELIDEYRAALDDLRDSLGDTEATHARTNR